MGLECYITTVIKYHVVASNIALAGGTYVGQFVRPILTYFSHIEALSQLWVSGCQVDLGENVKFVVKYILSW